MLRVCFAVRFVKQTSSSSWGTTNVDLGLTQCIDTKQSKRARHALVLDDDEAGDGAKKWAGQEHEDYLCLTYFKIYCGRYEAGWWWPARCPALSCTDFALFCRTYVQACATGRKQIPQIGLALTFLERLVLRVLSVHQYQTGLCTATSKRSSPIAAFHEAKAPFAMK